MRISGRQRSTARLLIGRSPRMSYGTEKRRPSGGKPQNDQAASALLPIADEPGIHTDRCTPPRGRLLSKRDKLLSNNAVLCATIFIMVWIETESPVVIETTGLFISHTRQKLIDNTLATS